MTPRLVKQLIYGFFYLLILAVILWIIYIAFLQPAPTCFDGHRNQGETGIDCGGPCASCELARLKDITVSLNSVVAVPAVNNKTTLLGQIENPNPGFGAQSFSYQFQIFGPFGALLKTIDGQSFVYAGERKYLVEPAISINFQDVKQVKLKIATSTTVWQSNEQMPKPVLSATSFKTEIKGNNVSVNGYIKNQNPLTVAETKIISIIYSSNGVILNASFTTLSNLNGYEERYFDIEIPKGDWTGQMDINQTKIFIEPAVNQ